MDAKYLNITSIQRLCIHDGPGLRTTVFLKGCYLNCPWCCNPEAISIHKEFFYNKDKCIYKQGIASKLCDSCEIVGGKESKYRCLLGTYIPVSRRITIESLINEITQDISFFEASKGGVTLSGGEPFLQAEQLLPLVVELKKRSITITVETSCLFPHKFLKSFLPYIDLYYIDLKFQYGFIHNNEFIIDDINFEKNLAFLQNKNANIRYRMVYITEAFNNLEKRKNLTIKLKSHNINQLELLCYHSLAENKYKQLEKRRSNFHNLKDEDVFSFLQEIQELYTCDFTILHI